MCKDCGCSITATADINQHQHHNHNHSHNHSHNQNHQNHQNLHHNPQLNEKRTIEVISKILDKNDTQAMHNRKHFDDKGVLAINLMSSPGSGKTTVLEKLIEVGDFRFCVIEGDLETSKDADRIRAKGVSAYQIQTGTACHLDAFMVHDGLHHISLDGVEVCFVENVGNLVCPASYDVGTHLNIVLVSVPEGDDKIEKYPVMFHQADLVLVTKTDLIEYFDFNLESVKRSARAIKPNVDILEFNIKDENSIKKLSEWIRFKISMR
jgi:hydrogenase nickel incorporation protein HypB